MNDGILLSKIKQLREINPNIGRDEIANLLGASISDVRALLLFLKKPELFEDKPNQPSEHFPDIFPAKEVFTDSLRIYSHALTIAADPHMPLIHVKMADRMIDMSIKFGCKTIVIPGDLFDQPMFSKYEHKDKTNEFEIEATATEQFVLKLCELFEDVIILPGNHDLRILKMLNYKWDFVSFVKKLIRHEKLIISNYPKLIVNDEWRIIHPKNYSTIRTRVPARKSLLEEQSIISCHGHHAGIAPSDNNKHVVVEACVLCDTRKVAYLAENETLYPKWVEGFNIIYNNTIYQFTDNPMMTDWDFWDKWEGVVK